jgi:hypothetical protein
MADNFWEYLLRWHGFRNPSKSRDHADKGRYGADKSMYGADKSRDILNFIIDSDKIALVPAKDDACGAEETENLDELVADEVAGKEPFEKNIAYEHSDIRQMDYESMFSYLGKSAKLNDFECGSYFSYDKPQTVEEESFFNPKMDMELVYEIVRAKKIRETLGVEVYVNPIKKSMFDDWKNGNFYENRQAWDLVNI